MNFRPDASKLQLWDTWVFVTEQDEVHLFYLANKPGGAWGYVGHAVSDDWLHWRDLPEIRLRGDDGAWDAGASGTGMVFRYDDGRYYMTYTGALSTNEATGLLTSEDLVHWEKVTIGATCWPRSTSPPYETDARRVAVSAAWRDAFVTRNPRGEWEAVCSARVDAGPAAGRACLARCHLDALDEWITLAPLAHAGRYSSMEVPEIFHFADRWWAIFSTGSGWGIRLDTPERAAVTGTFFLGADNWEGPYEAPRSNLLIGAGNNQMHSYVARVVRYKKQHLVYHHYASSPTAFGLPKQLVADGETLALAPWAGLSAIWRPAAPEAWRAYTFGAAQPGRWNAEGGRINGECRYGSDAFISECHAPAIDLEATVTLHRGRRAGIGVGVEPGQRSPGLVCLLDAGAGEITLSRFERWEHGNGLRLDDRIDSVKRRIRRGQTYHLRLLRRGAFLELFVDDRLVFSSIVPEPAGGAMACVLESAAAEFVIGRVHALEQMAR